MHFLPVKAEDNGDRGVDRSPSIRSNLRRGKYSPRRSEVQHTSSLLFSKEGGNKRKEKGSLGSLSHQKWFPSDLRKDQDVQSGEGVLRNSELISL